MGKGFGGGVGRGVALKGKIIMVLFLIFEQVAWMDP